MQARSVPAKRLRTLASVGLAADLWPDIAAHAGSARNYLNAPVDTCLINYNASYSTSATKFPETGAPVLGSGLCPRPKACPSEHLR
jgi:hypothetical protein